MIPGRCGMCSMARAEFGPSVIQLECFLKIDHRHGDGIMDRPGAGCEIHREAFEAYLEI